MRGTLTTTMTGIGTGLLTGLMGGWDVALEILLIIMVIDYLTGVASAFKTKAVSSNKGYMGIVKKAAIFAVVILAAQVDRVTGNASHLFRNSTAFFFIANDALSILENAGELGIKLPSFLKNALVKLREKNDSTPSSADENEESGKEITDSKSASRQGKGSGSE